MIKLSDHFTYKKLLRFCFPTIIMMIFTSIYSVIDGLFVSNFVGKTAFAAINLIIPFVMLMGGVGFMMGTGGSALVAKSLGAKQHEEANRYFSMMIWVTMITGIVLSLIGYVLLPQISIWLGADGEMLVDCVAYGRVVLLFNVAFMLQNVFQSFLITAEKPKLGLMVTVAAGVTNALLDALFIGFWKWGVVGAALATGIGQCVGGILPLCYFLRKNSSLLHLTKTRLQWRPILKACGNGASELMSNISGSLVAMLYNMQLLHYAGENGVAAYGVLMYVQFIFIAVFIGFSIGTAPIISYHYGAQNHSELKNMLHKSIRLMSGGGLIMMLLGQVFAHGVSAIFVGYDAQLLAITESAFRIYSFHFVLAGLNIFSSSFFTALNNGAISALVSFLRTLVFQMLSVLLLPQLLGLDGVWWAVSVAEVCACVISFYFIYHYRETYHYA